MREKFNIIKSSIIYGKQAGILNLIRTANVVFREPFYVNSIPIFIQIEPTIKCNLECKMCIAPYWEKDTQYLGLEKFKVVCNQFPYLRKISLVGVGEPLLNPEIFEIIEWAKSKRILIGFATNGTILTKKKIENILKVKPNWLNISIDGATKETYEKIRIGADFNMLMNNIKELVVAKGNNDIDISIWFVGIQDNIEELPQMVKLVSNLGIKKLNMQMAHNWGREDWKEKLKSERLNGNFVRLKEIITKTISLAKEEGIQFNYVNTPSNKSNRACQWPWKSCYITVEGFVTPCCIHGSDPNVINFGNIFEKQFHEIWNSPQYQEFRKSLKSDNPPKICIGCTSYYNKLVIE